MRCRKCFLCSALVLLLPAASLTNPRLKGNVVTPAKAASSKDGEVGTGTIAEAIVETISGVPIAPVGAAILSPLKLKTNDSTYHAAYLDAFSILKQDNTCSQFFGGSLAGIEVLNELALQLKKANLSKDVGIRMSGDYTNVINVATGTSYRIFKRAVVNVDGAFYRRQRSYVDPSIPNVGSFGPDTREARVLMLLHELAHMLRRRDGIWLIPDDGKDMSKSSENTKTLEKYCSEQIQRLAAAPSWSPDNDVSTVTR